MIKPAKNKGLSGGWPSALLPVFLAVFWSLPGSVSAETVPVPELLTNAADVLSLSEEQANEKVPILVRGVVTAAEPAWNGQFFVQDASGGVFVDNKAGKRPEPGDLVEVTGVSQPGAYAPVISKPSWSKLGTAPLPEARPVAAEQLAYGLEDGQRVEITGIVRSVTPAKTNLDVELASGGYRFHVFPKRQANIEPMNLIGAKVKVKGTAAASFNAKLRQLVAVVMFVPFTNDFVVQKLERANPFDDELIPLNTVAQYRRDSGPGKRVHVKGVVTLQRPGQDLFLKDALSGLHVRTHQTNKLDVGDVVEAVGFPAFDHFLPVLDDANFRKTTERRLPAVPKEVYVTNILAGLHHADLITLQANLLDRSVHPSQRSTTNALRKVVGLVLLRHEGTEKDPHDLSFTAEADVPEADDALLSIPIGSVVEVTGVCFTQGGEDKKAHNVQVLLADPGSVRVVQAPSWFTPQRLLIGSSMLLAVLLVALSWSVTVSKKNLVLKESIRDKEKAQHELQEAHDQLEERVKERTAQLKFQITARKESEVQYKAILTERTRLAQELHDTLEQTLTGIALQLDTTSKLFEVKPDNANHHLEMARSLVAQSQVDVRRSVWDLRSRALEQFDLPGALLTSGKQLVDGTNIHFDVAAKGRVRPLPETVEDNLLRIAQEALTNVIKHSKATTASIELDYGPQNVSLQIQDNGCGFARENAAGPGQGHFGLLGISERAKRLNAELEVTSEPGKGTTVRVQVPVDQNFQPPDLTTVSEVIA